MRFLFRRRSFCGDNGKELAAAGVYVLVPSPLFHGYTTTQLMISIQRANCARKGTPFLQNKEEPGVLTTLVVFLKHNLKFAVNLLGVFYSRCLWLL